MGVAGQHQTPAALPPGNTRYPFNKRPDGLQCRSGQMKISPPPGFDRRTVQPIASSCTDYCDVCNPMYVCMYVCIHIYTHTFMCLYYMYRCMYMYVYMYVCSYESTHARYMSRQFSVFPNKVFWLRKLKSVELQEGVKDDSDNCAEVSSTAVFKLLSPHLSA